MLHVSGINPIQLEISGKYDTCENDQIHTWKNKLFVYFLLTIFFCYTDKSDVIKLLNEIFKGRRLVTKGL